MNDPNSEERQPRTVVEQGTRIKGTMASSCPIDVHGRIEGEVDTPALHISPSGAVHGKAKVGLVSCEGEISGEIDAERVVLAGRVLDNTVIRAKSLSVNLSSDTSKMEVVFGQCEISVGDEPAERSVTNDVAAPEPMAATPSPEAVAMSPEPAAMEPEMPAMTAAPEAPPAEEAPAAESAEASEAEGEDASKGRKKRKNGRDEQRPAIGWSHTPSQPPPGN